MEDLLLLQTAVPIHSDLLHSIEQGLDNGTDTVGSANKQDIADIQFQIDEVILEF